MSVDVAKETEPETAMLVAARVCGMLQRSPFKHPKRWPHAVVVMTGENKRVEARVDFGAWLRANALPKLARECAHRTVKPGEVLVFCDLDLHVDGVTSATTAFAVLDLRAVLSAGTVRRTWR